jgi:hypothetical protein
MAGEGIFGDCTSGSYAWLDPGCLVESAGSAIGTTLTSALEPVWIILAVVVLLVILIGVLPNVRHIAPVVGRFAV